MNDAKLQSTHITEEKSKAQYRQLSAFLMHVKQKPYQYQLFALLRKLEVLGISTQPLGKAGRLKLEKIRLKQEPTLAFAPSSVLAVRPSALNRQVTEISTYGFGLFGPNGPLPLHLTEYVYERKHQYRDRVWASFADVFHHRAIALFYRAWANAQSVNALDGYDHWTFSRYLGSLMHIGSEGFRNRTSISDYAKYYFSGHFLTNRRPAYALVQILKKYFGVNCSIDEFIGRWINLDESHCTKLSLSSPKCLGDSPMLGRRAFDLQNKFRLIIGPLSWSEYVSFFRGGFNAQRLIDWVNLYTNLEFDWDVQLILSQKEVPQLTLGQSLPLGLATWLGKLDQDGNALILDLTATYK
ncbi:type VI secretion system baseplate subunit TssG [Neisseria sp. Ec49-e6-T10]|uniref:type VI secretion system baseplate subunit TssG n=1 Tax=Neisseria sp. Ec49-e6-T10 TaxID=3140744 RepID=UPI003EB8621B